MGDFDIDSMYEAGRSMAVTWFVLFQVLTVLIMLNMLLAIVMDAYSDVKGAMANTETVYEEAYHIFLRWLKVRQKEAVRLDLVHACLEKHALERIGTVELNNDWTNAVFLTEVTLTELVPGLESDQAQTILVSSVEAWHAENKDVTTIHDAVHEIHEMSGQMDHFFETFNPVSPSTNAPLLLETPRTKPTNPHQDASLVAVDANEKWRISIDDRLGRIEARLEDRLGTIENRLASMMELLMNIGLPRCLPPTSAGPPVSQFKPGLAIPISDQLQKIVKEGTLSDKRSPSAVKL